MGQLKVLPNGKRALTTPDLSRENAWYRQTLAELLDLLAKSKLRPLVSARVPLADAAHAHQLLESGKYRGKVVLVTGVYTEYLNGDSRARAAFKRARPASST